MIEPLSAFFILEGLLFDAIGAYLIATGIISFKFESNKTTYSLFAPVLTPILAYLLTNDNLPKKGKIPNSVLIETGEELAESEIFKERILEHAPIIKDAITEGKQKFNENRVYQGLPYLMGGFLLQGLGIIMQLV